MSTEAKYNKMFKEQAAAGLALREGIDAMLSLLEDGPVKQEMQKMIDTHIEACAKARPPNIPACNNKIDMNQH